VFAALCEETKKKKKTRKCYENGELRNWEEKGAQQT